jgi:hypothetical protein
MCGMCVHVVYTPQVGEGACCPSARRAHTLEVVGDRYLLLHGGYDGSSLLVDTWVFDTRSSRWLAIDVQGELCWHCQHCFVQLALEQYQLGH